MQRKRILDPTCNHDKNKSVIKKALIDAVKEVEGNDVFERMGSVQSVEIPVEYPAQMTKARFGLRLFQQHRPEVIATIAVASFAKKIN